MAGEVDRSRIVTPVAEKKGDVCREGKGEESDQEEPFTHFTLSQLRKLQLLVGLATTTSSLTATIYLPLLPLLRTHSHTSAQAVNLTLTIYIVFQAISPVVFGPLSDTYGRRPIFLLVLGIYAVSNIGLAVNERSFAVLATLRALQSLGASATYSIAFGVVADVCLPRDRGRMLGPIGMALNLGTCIGPIIGGCVAYFSGIYNWAFWALVIAAIILFSSVGLFLPETARSLVGNGSDRSRFKWWQISWLSLVQEFLAGGTGFARSQHAIEGTDQEKALRQTTTVRRFLQKYGLINFYNCFRIRFYKDTFLILWAHGSFYTVDYSFVAAVPDIFKSIYGWNEWQTGLAYLPRGTGIILGSYFTSKLLDHNYRTAARRIGSDESKKGSGGDLLDFPIEKSRTRGSFVGLTISTATMAGYGWGGHFINMRTQLWFLFCSLRRASGARSFTRPSTVPCRSTLFRRAQAPPLQQLVLPDAQWRRLVWLFCNH